MIVTITEAECSNGQGSLGNSDDKLTLVEDGQGTYRSSGNQLTSNMLWISQVVEPPTSVLDG